MSIVRACYVACDRCHQAAPVTVDGADHARTLARAEESFTRTPMGEDLCPSCAGKVHDGVRWAYPAASATGCREPS